MWASKFYSAVDGGDKSRNPFGTAPLSGQRIRRKSSALFPQVEELPSKNGSTQLAPHARGSTVPFFVFLFLSFFPKSNCL
jgi:hypothetical protein